MIIDAHDKDGRWVMTAIVNEMARLKAICNDPNAHEDDVSDASNDKGYYGAILGELEQELAGPRIVLHRYQCWSDPADDGIALIPFENVHDHRMQGQLSDAAALLYTVIAANWEEAMAVHHLRQGWAPYVPME
jgi:hypothetical protein